MSIQPAAYIMASQRNGTLYVGVTGALRERVYQHREALVDGFTKQYGVKILVHFEFFASMPEAIAREKQLKKMLRKAKLALINGTIRTGGIFGWKFSSGTHSSLRPPRFWIPALVGARMAAAG